MPWREPLDIFDEYFKPLPWNYNQLLYKNDTDIYFSMVIRKLIGFTVGPHKAGDNQATGILGILVKLEMIFQTETWDFIVLWMLFSVEIYFNVLYINCADACMCAV